MKMFIAEIGINYAFGEDKSKFLQNAKEMIDMAVMAKCDVVKFQKRTPELCVPEAQKNKPKSVPWRKKPTTYLKYKQDIEFGKEEYDEIDRYCKERGIRWTDPKFDIKWPIIPVEISEKDNAHPFFNPKHHLK